MTQRKRDGLSWGHDEKTATTVTPQHSHQRIKAIAKPGLSWDDDARTVARPADADLPAEAFRPGQAAPGAPVAALEVAIPLERRKVDVAAPLEQRLEKQPETQPAPSPELTPEAPKQAKQRRPRRSALRWVVLAVTVLAFYSASYTAVSVNQKLKAHASTAAVSGAAAHPLSIWAALGEVAAEAVAKVKGSK